MRRFLRFSVSAIVLAAASLPAYAATIVDTGPVPAQVSGAVYGGSASGSSGIAGRFTLSAATSITTIQFYGASIGSNFGNIRADGATPGASLYSGLIDQTDDRVNPYQWVGLSGLSWALGPGSYWVTFESPTAGDAFREAVNFPNPVPRQASQSAGVWQAENSFAFALRVEGDAVTAAVPEPASWVMMIVGFGLLGGTLRRQRLQASLVA